MVIFKSLSAEIVNAISSKALALKMKHNPKGITTAMQLYFSGESLRNVAHSLKLIGVEVSHQTIYNWIDKYTTLMEKYLDKITPKVSTAWRTDELYLKVKGIVKAEGELCAAAARVFPSWPHCREVVDNPQRLAQSSSRTPTPG